MFYLLLTPQDSTQTLFGLSHEVTELLKIIIPVIAILVSVFTFIFTFIRTGNTNKNNTLENIRNRINSARARMEDFSVIVTESDKESTEFQKTFNSILEDYINSYDEACTKFYSNSVKRKIFNRNFLNDIKSIFNRENTRILLDDKRHKFLDLWKYNDDENKEKFHWSGAMITFMIITVVIGLGIFYFLFSNKSG